MVENCRLAVGHKEEGDHIKVDRGIGEQDFALFSHTQ